MNKISSKALAIYTFLFIISTSSVCLNISQLLLFDSRDLLVYLLLATNSSCAIYFALLLSKLDDPDFEIK